VRERPLFLASVLLVVVALGLHFGSLCQISKGVSRGARSVTAAGQQKQQMQADADRCISTGEVLGLIGLGFAVSSLACLVVSFLWHEPARRFIPVTLLVFYLMLQFVLV
jgi:hypothetical protein